MSEIVYEDLQGPSAPATIALEVREDDGTSGRKGIGLVGSCLDFPPRFVYCMGARSPQITLKELAGLAAEESRRIARWKLDFSDVSIPSPEAGWQEARNSPEGEKLYQRYSLQRDGQAAAMQVVKDLHVAANAENAINRESLAICCKLMHQPLSPRPFLNRCDPAITPHASFYANTTPPFSRLPQTLFLRAQPCPPQPPSPREL